MEEGREFQILTTRQEKKLCLMEFLASGIWRRRGCPLEVRLFEGEKRAERGIAEKPETILKQVTRSVIRRRCSRD